MSVKAYPNAVRTTRLGRAVQIGELGPIVLVLSAVGLWLGSLGRVDLDQMTDVGLISVLPAPMFVALMVLTTGYVLALRERPLRIPILLLHIAALIFMLYGVAALLEDVPRFQGGWKHAGVIDYIIRTGDVDPRIDAYFNWPGFFILGAFVTEVSGFQSPMSLVGWAPVAFNLLYFGPLWMIFSSMTNDRRLKWLALWFFYATNWIGQDYFSPQALNYFFYLVIIGSLLRWFRSPTSMRLQLFKGRLTFAPRDHIPLKIYQWLAPADAPVTPTSRGQQIALLLILATIFAVVVSSHQLSPFATLAGVSALVVFNRCWPRWLPIPMGVMIALWLRFMASDYMAGHGEQVTGQVGSVGTAVGANVTARFEGSAGHVFVVYIRIGLTLALWGAAFLGALRRLWHGHRDLTLALLGAAPFPLAVAQPYGGEMLLRVYLFSLPFVAFFVAALFYTASNVGRSRWTTMATGLATAVWLVGFLFIRHGNERMDRYTSEEVAATRHLYSIAQPGSVLIAGTPNTPWKDRDYERYRYRSLTNELAWDPATVASPVEATAAAMNNSDSPATYLIITESQIANDDLFAELPIPLRELKPALLQSSKFRVIYSNEDATIFVLADGTNGTAS